MRLGTSRSLSFLPKSIDLFGRVRGEGEKYRSAGKLELETGDWPKRSCSEAEIPIFEAEIPDLLRPKDSATGYFIDYTNIRLIHSTIYFA